LRAVRNKQTKAVAGKIKQFFPSNLFAPDHARESSRATRFRPAVELQLQLAHRLRGVQAIPLLDASRFPLQPARSDGQPPYKSIGALPERSTAVLEKTSIGSDLANGVIFPQEN
jgi:hypothetical protein